MSSNDKVLVSALVNSPESVSVEVKRGKGRPKGAINILTGMELLLRDYCDEDTFDVEVVSQSFTPPYGYNKDGSVAQKRGRKALEDKAERESQFKITKGVQGKYSYDKLTVPSEVKEVSIPRFLDKPWNMDKLPDEYYVPRNDRAEKYWSLMAEQGLV